MRLWPDWRGCRHRQGRRVELIVELPVRVEVQRRRPVDDPLERRRIKRNAHHDRAFETCPDALEKRRHALLRLLSVRYAEDSHGVVACDSLKAVPQKSHISR